MNRGLLSTDCQDWICPDLTAYWRLARLRDRDRVLLRSKPDATASEISRDRQYQFSEAEGFALRHFTGRYAIADIQARCQKQFAIVDAQLVVRLVQKLIALGILELEGDDAPASTTNPPSGRSPSSPTNGPQLKSCLKWIRNSDGYWILRNPEDVTFLQVGDRDREIINDIGRFPSDKICQRHDISKTKLQQLLRLLASTGMLQGTQPAKPKRGKFHPMQLLFFKVPLFNPDGWLNGQIDKLRWIWTRGFGFFLIFFLAISTVVGLSQKSQILHFGTELWQTQSGDLIVPFALLAAIVVAIHELGHAFTLKNYGGIVPEIGFLFMCLFPAAYTNTTDSYSLSRFQRVQVVAAGVLTQLAIAAISLWLWNLSVEGNWLYVGSYLLMAASLFTVALNLNPLAKFDGYHLAVAATGINNLRGRSFMFYGNLLRGRSPGERPKDARILALYAPLSLAYIWMVFGFLFARLGDWILTNVPMTAAILLVIWAIYFYAPFSDSSPASRQ